MSSGVETQHPEYAARVIEWQMIRDVLAGSRAVKFAAELYLPALANQKSLMQPGTGRTAYDAYRMRAKFYAATARTQQALVGTIFHKDLVVDGPAALLDQLTDITLSDTPIEDFAVQVLGEVVALGRYGILVDMPDETDPQETRPYWVGYRTEQITNWRETSARGETYPTLVVLKEEYEIEINDFESTKHEQYRVLQLVPHPLVPLDQGGKAYVQRIWQKVVGADGKESKEFTLVNEIIPMKLGVPLSFIPFQTFGPTTLGLCPEKPPLSEMAETNLHMYRRSADLEHGRHFTGLPTAVVSGMQPPPPGATAKPLTVGSSEAWLLPVDGKAFYLEFSGQGLSALVDGIKEDKEEMASLGSEMFAAEPDSGNVETATAVRVRQSAKTASLKTLARRLSSGLSNCLQWHAWWLGATETPDDASIIAKVNEVFLDLRMSPDELKAWVLALQAGSVAFATFYAQLEQGELTRPGVTAEQEKAQIDAEAPPPVDPLTGLPMDAQPKVPGISLRTAPGEPTAAAKP